MQFNNYLWQLYKQTGEYKKEIEYANNMKSIDFLIDDFTNPDANDDDKNKLRDEILFLYEYFKSKDFNYENVDEVFKSCIETGIKYKEDFYIEENNPTEWYEGYYSLRLSDILYSANPDLFFIYRFDADNQKFNFKTFQEICEYFEIALPPIPARAKKIERALYYIDICKALHEFRKLNDLTEEELYAFVYDYAYNIITDDEDENDEEELTKPSKVWFIVENPIDNSWVNELEKLSLPHRWQFGENVTVGDIIILYCSKPHGGLHSIWRASDSSSIDPLFNWYKVGYIDKPTVIPNITLKEMRENKILSGNKKVMINFYCANGSPVSYEEYQEILRILKEEKNFDISILPNIEPIIGLDESIILNDERDVEIYLVEPLLKLLGYSTTDYIRQMPIRMGRGIRYYPDYAFFANVKRGEETAKWVLETKYTIRSEKDFREAFYQARSYAMRLYCKNFVLASKEGIWLFSADKKNNFNFDSYKKYSWNELKHSDNMHNVLQIVGIGYIKKLVNKKYK